MGEVDTKPFESVQAALSLFGEKNDQRKYRSSGSENKQGQKDEWELTLIEIANYKMQLEVKEYAHKQALLKVESCNIIAAQLYGQLKNCEAERDQSIEKSREARKQIERLESRIEEMSNLLLEARDTQEQLVRVENELDATLEELDFVKAELAASEESKVSAMTQAEHIENAFELEKEKNEDLLRHVSDLNEAVCLSKVAYIESEKGRVIMSSEKDEAKQRLEKIREKMKMIEDMENLLLCKTICIDYLLSELTQAKELVSSSQHTASIAINDLNQLKSEFQFVGSEKFKELQSELEVAKEEIDHLNRGIDTLASELRITKNESVEISKRELEGQVEIALLQGEIHKGRSKVAAAEAAEARALSVKSGLYLAVKQLAIEAKSAKIETKELKLESENIEAHIEESPIQKTESAGRIEDACILEPANKSEIQALKKELEAAKLEIKELRLITDQAMTKADQADKAKIALEGQLRKWREHKERRRAATIAALREDLTHTDTIPPTIPTPYQPLSKVLNMKF
ncbi:hypothetical protein ACHQM5_006468 [Ranunculus cassubicifolius]